MLPAILFSLELPGGQLAVSLPVALRNRLQIQALRAGRLGRDNRLAGAWSTSCREIGRSGGRLVAHRRREWRFHVGDTAARAAPDRSAAAQVGLSDRYQPSDILVSMARCAS